MTHVDGWLFALTLFAALGCGLIAGVFFAFSSFVMKAFANLPSYQGMAAMQAVNIAVINPLFLGVFLGTAVACALIMLYSILRWQQAGAIYLLAGGALYLVGSLLVTIVCNVPRNNALARVTATDPEGERLWANYLVSWTAWNHVRTLASLAAAALLIIALSI